VAAGIQPTQAQVNANAGGLALNLRAAMQAIVNFQAWLSATQTAATLEALGFTPGDAATLISSVGNLNTLASIYQGTATQPAVFNYEANSNALWGGQ
jgi:hypothetical protein